MTWIVSDARVLASAEVASTRTDRRRGLLGRDHVDGALLIPRCRWVHTFGMRFDLDVAYLDADGRVLSTRRMRRRRLGMPVPAARTVIEAEAGAFARWGLRPGDVVELRRSDVHGTDDDPGRGAGGDAGQDADGGPRHDHDAGPPPPPQDLPRLDPPPATGSTHDDATSRRSRRRLEPVTV